VGQNNRSKRSKARNHNGGSAALPKRKMSRRNSDYVLEDQIGFQLRLAMQRHTAIFVASMVLTQTQFATIVKLYDVGPCSQNHLARLVALDAATINGVLDRLRKRGYVSIESDQHDARQRVIAITTAGRRAVERAINLAKKVTRETLAPLSAREAAQLSRLLTKIS
jgi:DNA-binding MarR family transcriptional regulator